MNLIVMGQPYSGTTLMTDVLSSLGWNSVDNENQEHSMIRRINDQIISDGRIRFSKALDLVSTLPLPWVIKDPMFIFTLEHWRPVFNEFQVQLIVVRRSLDSVKLSYESRNKEPYAHGKSLVDMDGMLFNQYTNWNGPKQWVIFEDFTRTLSTFVKERADGRSRQNED